jgi:hypothetical protein
MYLGLMGYSVNMEPPDVYLEGELSAIVDVLDTAETARYQLGTLSRASEGLEDYVAELRSWLEGVQLFFSDRRRVALTAASIILAASLVDLLRGWVAMRFRHATPRGRERKRAGSPPSPTQENSDT